jgi:hypothetical protein
MSGPLWTVSEATVTGDDIGFEGGDVGFEGGEGTTLAGWGVEEEGLFNARSRRRRRRRRLMRSYFEAQYLGFSGHKTSFSFVFPLAALYYPPGLKSRCPSSAPPISRTSPSPSSPSDLHPHASTNRFTRSADIIRYRHPSDFRTRVAAIPRPAARALPSVAAPASAPACLARRCGPDGPEIHSQMSTRPPVV